MFGTRLFDRLMPGRRADYPLFEKPKLVSESSTDLQGAVSSPSLTLVSAEDIYRAGGRESGRAGEPVLLLKKGMEIEATQMPRLMRNGVKPSQFFIKPTDGDAQALENFSGFPVTHPLRETSAGLAKRIRGQKRVLMLDTDSKSMRRLTDCLFMCGFQLDNLHPVRLASSLHWALQKYLPHVLVVDYRLGGKQNGIQVLHAIKPVLPTLEQVILTAPPLHTLPGWEARRVEAFCEAGNAYLLFKPVNRFALKRILDLALQNAE